MCEILVTNHLGLHAPIAGLGNKLNFPDSASLKFDVEAVSIPLNVSIDLFLAVRTLASASLIETSVR